MPKASTVEVKDSTKKLKYLKKPRMPRLVHRDRYSHRRGRRSGAARSMSLIQPAALSMPASTSSASQEFDRDTNASEPTVTAARNPAALYLSTGRTLLPLAPSA